MASGFLPGVDAAGAISRRINDFGTRQTMNPMAPGQLPNGPDNAFAPLPGYSGPVAANGGIPGASNPMAAQPQVADPNNPLSGGTGDPMLDQFLGTDSTYQTQLSNLMRQQDQYNAQKGLTASQTKADYDAKIRAMNDQTKLDQTAMQNSAAARGMLNSGIYANQLGQYNQTNQQNMTNLLGGQQNAIDNAQMAYTNFISNEIAAKQDAIQQAAARRAAQLGQF